MTHNHAQGALPAALRKTRERHRRHLQVQSTGTGGNVVVMQEHDFSAYERGTTVDRAAQQHGGVLVVVLEQMVSQLVPMALDDPDLRLHCEASIR
jgi:hypothetical protein